MSKLGMLLTTTPEHENTKTVLSLAREALALGHEVRVFLMADGVYNALLPSFRELASAGAQVIWCSHNAGERGIAAPSGIEEGSQYDLACMTDECDRFLAFN